MERTNGTVIEIEHRYTRANLRNGIGAPDWLTGRGLIAWMGTAPNGEGDLAGGQTDYYHAMGLGSEAEGKALRAELDADDNVTGYEFASGYCLSDEPETDAIPDGGRVEQAETGNGTTWVVFDPLT